jgi:hypothetical protein
MVHLIGTEPPGEPVEWRYSRWPKALTFLEWRMPILVDLVSAYAVFTVAVAVFVAIAEDGSNTSIGVGLALSIPIGTYACGRGAAALRQYHGRKRELRAMFTGMIDRFDLDLAPPVDAVAEVFNQAQIGLGVPGQSEMPLVRTERCALAIHDYRSTGDTYLVLGVLDDSLRALGREARRRTESQVQSIMRRLESELRSRPVEFRPGPAQRMAFGVVARPLLCTGLKSLHAAWELALAATTDAEIEHVVSTLATMRRQFGASSAELEVA